MIFDGYTWLKALHVAAALLFAGGVLAISIALAILARMPGQAERFAAAARRYDRLVTVPAMLAVWAFGIGVALSGSWFGSGWLNAKLLIVVVLSGIHGLQSGQLRRAAAGDVVEVRWTMPTIIASIVMIAVLVVVKPTLN
ncbi:CopD family protein [Tardiphaga sp. 768_D3_N2_1]|uniref:CopD family protein n=1 Tax=Tardiphaga sp. 768_D3_N2_1 TaxID=3240783 RepID=UPI003F8AFEB5